MIIAITVTTTMATEESDDKSQIRSMGTDKFVPTFLISDSSPPIYFHYHHHHHHHHYYYYCYHYNINKYLCLSLNTYTYGDKRM